MTAACVDSSWLVSIAFAEEGHEHLCEILGRFETLVASSLMEAELLSACARERLEPDPAWSARLSWILPDRTLRPEIERVLAAGHLRGADLWHVACALFLSPDPTQLSFLTLDRQQGDVASRLGFRR